MKLSIQELLIILAIVLIIFGPSQLPKLAKMFGKSVNGFKKSLNGNEEKTSENEEKDA